MVRLRVAMSDDTASHGTGHQRCDLQRRVLGTLRRPHMVDRSCVDLSDGLAQQLGLRRFVIIWVQDAFVVKLGEFL